MKIYLAGPMRGIPELNFPAFEHAVLLLRKRGHIVTSPHEQDIKAGYAADNQRPWTECAIEDARFVLQSDAVAVLPGWEKSRGARFEVMTALAADNKIRIVDAFTLEDIADPHQLIYNATRTQAPKVASATAFFPTDQLQNGKTTADGIMRTFQTGATRSADTEKHDYEGFLSPLALDLFGNYMHKHRKQADGTTRASDNWQKGIPLTAYIKSTWRHFVHLWRLHRGHRAFDEKGVPVTMEDTLGALIFNIQGYAHEWVKEQEAKQKPVSIAESLRDF